MLRGKGVSTEEDRAFDASVGERIRNLRLASGRTQTDIARSAGVTFQQMQKYERGANRVAASRLAAIAKALDVPASRLLGEGEPVPVLQQSVTVDVHQLVENYRSCAPSARSAVSKLAQVLARA